jgi:hypothetical protein
MGLFDGQKKKANDSYSQKYPLSDSISNLQAAVNAANVELVGLRNYQPEKGSDKRARQRNITALSNRIMQLQNKIKDLKSGMSGNDILRIAAPSLTKLSDITSNKILNTTPYSFQIPTYNTPTLTSNLLATPKYAPAKTTDARDLADSVENGQGLPVDGEPTGTQEIILLPTEYKAQILSQFYYMEV